MVGGVRHAADKGVLSQIPGRCQTVRTTRQRNRRKQVPLGISAISYPDGLFKPKELQARLKRITKHENPNFIPNTHNLR